MGGIAVRRVAENRLDELAGHIEYIRNQGLLSFHRQGDPDMLQGIAGPIEMLNLFL